MNGKTDYSTLKNLKREKPKFLYEYLKNNNYKTSEDSNFQNYGGLRTKGIYKSPEKSKPLISVITVSLNSEKTIEKTIVSVLEQSYDNIEYIIVDGKSNDQTLNIIKKYESSIDLWISEKDKGIFNAINKGIKLSSGNIIAILNSDDIFTKDALVLVNNYFRRDVDFIFGSVEKDRLLSGFHKVKIKWKFNIFPAHSSGFFISRDAQIKVGLYDESFKLHADYDLIYKLIVKLKLKGIAMERNEITGKFNIYGKSSYENRLKYYYEEFRIRKKNKQNFFFIFFLLILKYIYLFLFKIKFLKKFLIFIRTKLKI